MHVADVDFQFTDQGRVSAYLKPKLDKAVKYGYAELVGPGWLALVLVSRGRYRRVFPLFILNPLNPLNPLNTRVLGVSECRLLQPVLVSLSPFVVTQNL